MMIAIAGFFAGIISGMGIGGGAILIPVLLWSGELTQQQAQGVNLLYFLPTALMALRVHHKEGNLALDVSKKLILPGLIGALCGALLAVWLKGELLRKLFGGFLFLMGLREIHLYRTMKQEEKKNGSKT